MLLNIAFSARPALWDEYDMPLRAAFAEAGIAADMRPQSDAGTPHPAEDVDYIICAPDGPVDDFTPFVRAKAVLNLWAGVEQIVGNPTLTQPLVRMVDPSLTAGMVEWVTGHVLRHHLGMDAHILAQPGDWAPVTPPLAQDRPVTILGLGELGTACALALARLGFPVTGWSRSPKAVEGITCRSGPDGFDQALDGAEILILLLPLTAQTENIIDRTALSRLAPGAVLLNPGRGALIDDDAVLTALDAGQLSHATLDVFRTEPLPADHRYWTHPRVTVTPHIASVTRAGSAARVIARTILASEAGAPLSNLVDRDAGY